MKTFLASTVLACAALCALALPTTGVLAAPMAAEKTAPPKTETMVLLPTLIPDGVADAVGKTAFLRNAEGGVEAIEIATGKTKWTTKTIAKPLLALPDRLVVQVPVEEKTNELKIAILDSATGKQLLLSDALVFPDWVIVAAEDGAVYGSNFMSEISFQEQELSLTWNASAHYAGGAAPMPEIEEAARHNESGVFHVNLKTGQIKSSPLPIANAKGAANDIRPYEQLPWNLVWVNGVACLINRDEPKNGVAGNWSIVETINGDKIGEVDLGYNPEVVKMINSNIFWVTSSQEPRDFTKQQSIARELSVADIKTGKTLWKRALKPKEIMMLPM